MEFIPLNRSEIRLLRKMLNNQLLDIKVLSKEEQNTLINLATHGLVSDYYRCLTMSEQLERNISPENYFFINDTGKRHYLNYKQERTRFMLPLIISVIAVIVSISSVIINIFGA